MTIREPSAFVRLSTDDVRILGRYLFGARWQAAMSVELGISRRQIVYWATSQRPVSRKYSERIANVVGEWHRRRIERARVGYKAMIAGISSESARSLILALLAEEIAVRSEVVSLIARGDQTPDLGRRNFYGNAPP